MFPCPSCKGRGFVTTPPISRSLSVRHRRVMDLLIQGKTNKEIASEMCVSEGSVKVYLSNAIFPRLGVHNRNDAVRVYLGLP